jgi:hypothetical protein
MKRIAACVIACFLVIGLFARTAPAQRAAEADAPTAAPVEIQPGSSERKGKWKADVAKLVAETKAGKRSVVPNSQFPQPHSNSLSKAAKIGIVVAIVVVVVAIVAVKSFKYDCKSRCVL